MNKPTMKTAFWMTAPLAVLLPMMSTSMTACGGSSSPPGGEQNDTGGSTGSQTGGRGGSDMASGGSGGTSSSTLTNGGNTAGNTGTGTTTAPPCAAGDALASDAAAISIFEDGFGTVSADLELSGGWYTYKDNTMAGTIMPAVGVAPVPAEEIAGGRCQGAESLFGLHVVGGGFDDWGAGTGTDLAFMSPAANAPVGTPGMRVGFDASAYKGIAFWAKKGDTPGATSSVRLNVKDVQTDPDGMMCSTAMPNGPMACHDDFGKGIALTSEWRKHTILFAEMKQQKFGKEYPAIKTDALYAIQFQFPKSTKFDFWLDDLHFVK